MTTSSVFKKLRLDDSLEILVVNAPNEFARLLKDVPHDKTPGTKKSGAYDFVQVFASNQKELEKLLTETKDAGKRDCLFWACYPKGSGALKSDIKRDTVWHAFQAIGLKTVTQIALDDTWSAMRARPQELVGK